MTDNREPLRAAVIDALRTVEDPEIPVNLYDLGLIYALEISDAGDVEITMTLTTPNCPVAEQMPEMVRKAVAAVEGVASVKVSLTWEPAWTREMITEDGQMILEFMGIDWSDPKRPLTTGGVTPLTFGGRKPDGPDRPT